MQALAIVDRGSSPELHDVAVPHPAAGEVLVAVEAASVNGADAGMVAGMLWDHIPHTFPVVVGRDFAGTVTAVGHGVNGVAVGDLVAGVLPAMGRLGPGTFGEFVVAPARAVAAIPAGMATTTAAAVGLAGIAALDVLDAAGVDDGDVVVISGATGGVGHYAVQLAARRGATVIATTTPGEEALLRSLGAAHTVDYTGDLAAQLRAVAPEGVDEVIHTAGDPATVAAALRQGGTLASTVGATAQQIGRDDVEVVAVFNAPTAKKLTTLLSQVVDGTLRPQLSATVPFERAGDALAAFLVGNVGKVVVTR